MAVPPALSSNAPADPAMQPYIDYLMEKYNSLSGDTWAWFSNLTREEWLVVLAVVSAAGFLCMRGFGSRTDY